MADRNDMDRYWKNQNEIMKYHKHDYIRSA